MCGGVSHLDTFDPKGNKWAGKLIDVVGFGDNLAEMKRPVIPCLRKFTPSGKSGIPVSDWFPHVGSVIDEIAVVRSMWCVESNHFTAVTETSTGIAVVSLTIQPLAVGYRTPSAVPTRICLLS